MCLIAFMQNPGFHNAILPLIVDSNCMFGYSVSTEAADNGGLVKWGYTSCKLGAGCYSARQYVLLKEINCSGTFPKCFLLCSYLSKYSFQLLKPCQCSFFILFALVFVCVSVPGSLFQQQYKHRMKHNLTFWLPQFPVLIVLTSKHIDFYKHFSAMLSLFSCYNH